MDDNRIISGDSEGRIEETFEKSLRPQYLSEYIGQDDLKKELSVSLKLLNNVKKL